MQQERCMYTSASVSHFFQPLTNASNVLVKSKKLVLSVCTVAHPHVSYFLSVLVMMRLFFIVLDFQAEKRRDVNLNANGMFSYPPLISKRLTPALLEALTWNRYERPGDRPATIQSSAWPRYTDWVVLSDNVIKTSNSVTGTPPS